MGYNMANILSNSEKVYDRSKSAVYRVEWKGRTVAIKHIPRRFCVLDSTGRSLESIAIQRLQAYDNIPQYIDTLYYDEDIYIITEWVNGTNAKEYIQQRLRPISEKNVRAIVHQVAGVLKGCNTEGLIYGDTKAENVMIEPSGRVKVIDFGCTRPINTANNCYMGTPAFFSPEMFDKVFLPEYDVWGLGVLAYYLACGSHPFLEGLVYNKNDLPIIKQAITKKELSFLHPVWKEWSDNGKTLIAEMLQKDPFMRPSIADVYKNKWFENV